MSDDQKQQAQTPEVAPRPQGNRPDIYIQEVVRAEDGSTTFKDIGATWQKQGYYSGKLDGDRSIVVRTYEQREALFAVRKAQAEKKEREKELGQEPAHSQSL